MTNNPKFGGPSKGGRPSKATQAMRRAALGEGLIEIEASFRDVDAIDLVGMGMLQTAKKATIKLKQWLESVDATKLSANEALTLAKLLPTIAAEGLALWSKATEMRFKSARPVHQDDSATVQDGDVLKPLPAAPVEPSSPLLASALDRIIAENASIRKR